MFRVAERAVSASRSTEEAVRHMRPKVLLQENVRALINSVNMPDFREWCRLLEGHGYVNFLAPQFVTPWASKKAALSSVFMSRWMNPVSVWYPSSVLCIIRPLVVHCPLRGALVFSLSFGNHSVCLFIDFLCTFLQLQLQHRH